MMHAESLRMIAHRGLVVGPAPLLRYQERGRYAVAEGVILTGWGIAGASFNKAAALGATPPLARIQELADAFFGAGAGAYGVLVEADAGHPVEAELRAAGWKVLEDEPALVLPTLPPLPPAPVDLDIRRVTDAAGRRDFAAAAAAGFGASTSEVNSEMGEEAMNAFGPSLAAALDRDVAVFVGYADGRAVSSSIMYRVEEIAVLTGVATVPAYRRRGFARALTWAAVRAGADLGCTRATLGGLGASYEMYRGMGFLHVCNHRLYIQPV
jgi:ribosomal protein S18 acetylase RimI-like enzyme